jgi:uroporphyrinogen-III synthase
MQQGLPAVALPLIDIGPCTAPAAASALAKAQTQWRQGHWKAAMFVSSNAVRHFFDKKTPLPLDGIDFAAIKSRAWAPGPGTALALQTAGIPDNCIDSPVANAEQFDSESLWQQVQHQVQPGDAILIVRGDSPAPQQASHTTGNKTGAQGTQNTTQDTTQGTGREWLSTQIIAAGATVSTVATYQRQPAHWNSTQIQLASLAAQDGSIWLFSSSEGLHWLAQRLPNASWQNAKAITTHPRIAATAQSLGFGRVQICRPALADVIASIESIL